MRVLALNGSPRGYNGNTEVILKQFLKGCKNAGAEVETIYLKDKKINHCCGCFTCWQKTPGKCIHKDDMEDLLVKVSDADVIVYATPLYYYTVTGIMKDFMDRMLPLNCGEIIKNKDSYSHPSRNKRENPTKTVLISNCGFPGEYNFSGLLETFKVMTKGTLAASILCAQGGILQAVETNETLKNLYKPFFSALFNAGEEVVTQGYMNDDTKEVLHKNVIDSRTYVMNANKRLS